MIAGHLDGASLANYRLVSKKICTWTKDAPKMNPVEWREWNKDFETRIRRRKKGQLLSFACCKCHKVLGPTHFSDEQKRKSFAPGKKFWNGRRCLRCGILRSRWGSSVFRIDGVNHFGCVGCLQAKKLHVEDKYWTEGIEDEAEAPIPYYRWCKTCGPKLRNYRMARRIQRRD